MLISKAKIFLLCPAVLVLAVFVCAPAFAAPVDGVEVEVRNAEGNFVGANLIDGDSSTAWVGGGSGVGPGKWIEFTFPVWIRLESLKVANGHQGKGRFERFRRLTRGVILYPDDTRQKFTLKPEAGVQTIRLEPKAVRNFRVIITGVAPDAGDKAMGKAKVAVSEMTVFGEATDPPEESDGLEADLPREVETAAGKPEPVVEPKPIEKPKSIEKPKPVAKAKPVVKTEAKQPAPVPAKAAPVKKAVPEKKPAPVKKAQPAKAAKPVVKVKRTPAAKPLQPKNFTYLRQVKTVPADAPLDMGRISPWLDLEVVASIKRFLSHLTTLSDSYPEVLASSVREKEAAAFRALQADLRNKKEFNHHHIAMLELIGLSFDKPEESGGTVSTRVHGPCRYYVDDTGYEFAMDAVFTLVNEGGAWRVSAVRDL